MPRRSHEFLRLRNHQEVRAVLAQFADGADLSWFDQEAIAVCKRWYWLAQQHLRVAKRCSHVSREWRSTVSRAYYAVYNASKSVRYYVSGHIGLDNEDHKRVGDLPDDFPNRGAWSSFAVELRRDRNLADYDPWEHVRNSLSYDLDDTLARAIEFVRECRNYLRSRGVPL